MTRPLSAFHFLFAATIIVTLAGSVSAQATDDDAALDLAEPDFSLVNLPTTLRLPAHKGDFHLTHRFGLNLRDDQSTFGDKANSLFGLDSGATVGFQFRFGVMRHLQAIAHRESSNKTIQLGLQYDGIRQSDAFPVSVSGIVSVEAPNNFHARFNGITTSHEVEPALGAVVSRKIGDIAAVYATPMWVHNSAAALGIDRDTFLLGLGGRVRVASTVYVVVEAAPRLAGYDPGQTEYGFGIEKRAGAHVFQLTFANTIGTTYGQIARGGAPETLYLGFNLTRKFF